QCLPPSDGQPTSAIICLMVSLPCVRTTSRFCQKLHVHDAATVASTPAKKGWTFDITMLTLLAISFVQLSPRSDVAIGMFLSSLLLIPPIYSSNRASVRSLRNRTS